MNVSARVPPEVVREALAALGMEASPDSLSFTQVHGGCINPAVRAECAERAPFFLKWSREPGRAGFGVEARGLEAIRASGGPRVPEVLGVGEGEPGTHGWLALELVRAGSRGAETAARLGRELARLHRPIPFALPGWEEDGWIGSLPQPNLLEGVGGDSWPDFWRDTRLHFQWQLVFGRFDGRTKRRWDVLLDAVGEGLEGWQADGISLLHGDLWSGNVLTAPEGEPVLVDPAVYRGHREVDLAMMELFGGFEPDVMAAYRDEAPLDPAYAEIRRDLYQLYPLLVHVNLFGEGYVAGARARIERVLAELNSPR